MDEEWTGSPPRDPLLLLAEPFTGGDEWRWLRPLLEPAFQIVAESRDAARPSEVDSDALNRRLESELVAGDRYPAHLLATGFATAAAVRLATRRPELVRSVILHDPVLWLRDGDSPATEWNTVLDRFRTLTSALTTGRGVDLRALWSSAWGLDGPPPPELLGTTQEIPGRAEQWLAEWDHPESWSVESKLLPEFHPPVLLLSGERSPNFVHQMVHRLDLGFPNATRLTLPAADHSLPWREPQRLAGVLLTFCLERNVPSS